MPVPKWLKCLNRLTLTAVVLGLLAGFPGRADDEVVKDAPAQKTPLAKYVTVTSPINDLVFARVTNAAIGLQHLAERQDRQAILVLEIGRGTSKFGQVSDLAKELTSAKYSRVLTVAWIPETDDRRPLDGNNVILAISCDQIVMHPDVEMGDIGRGQALDPVEQQTVVGLVEKRRNPKVNRALVQGMMDPQKVVLKVKIEHGDDGGNTESRVVSREDYERLRENRVAIPDVETIKEAGVAGTFSGSQARALDVLVVDTAENRVELANLYQLPPEALREDPTFGETPKPQLIKIDGMIEPIVEGFVEREIRRAVASGVNLLIFEIDSPGGFLVSSTNLAHTIADLDEKQVRTVAYVPKLALSGAAIIALGCNEIYMRRDAQMGDAAPIEMKEGGQFEHAPEKVLSPLRETLRTLAEKQGRPPALAEAMADKDLVVYEVTHRETGRIWYMSDADLHAAKDEWIKGPVVPESKEANLLTVNGRRAHELNLAQPPVADIDELKQQLGVPPEVTLAAVGRTWVDTLVFLLNTPAAMFLLFLLGAACVYLELYTMTGFFGICAGLCFALFFWSRFLGGTAEWLEVVLFLFGLALIALEIFVIPGFGVFGISGGISVVVALILASQTFVIPQTSAELHKLTWSLGTLSASVLSVIVLAMVMSHFLPRMPLLNRVVLSPPHGSEPDDSEEPQLPPEFSHEASPTRAIEQDRSLIGHRGTALTMLRPAGKAQIADRYVDVVSDGPFIAQGTPIQVVQVVGNRVVVREA